MKSLILIVCALFTLHSFSQTKTNFELDFSEVVDISEPPVFIPEQVVEKFAEENNLENDQVKFKVIKKHKAIKTEAVVRNEAFINQVLPVTVYSSSKEDEEEKKEK